MTTFKKAMQDEFKKFMENEFQTCKIVGHRTPTKRKFIPRPLSVKLGDLVKYNQEQKISLEEAVERSFKATFNI